MIPEKMLVDHANGDKWDNRPMNLRLATKSQNGWNRGKQLTNTSGFKGVYVDKGGRIYSMIYAHRKKTWLGFFPSREEAADAYKKAATEIHGEFART